MENEDLYWEQLYAYWTIRRAKMAKQVAKLQRNYGCVMTIARLQEDIKLISKFIEQLESRYESLASKSGSQPVQKEG